MSKTKISEALNKNLGQALGITYEPDSQLVPLTQEPPSKIVPLDKDVKQDFDYSRSNLYGLIDKGNEALDGILEVAKESQHPRAYEVASNMIKNLSDVTDKLLRLQEVKKSLGESGQKNNEQATNVTVEKAVFVGTTADLLDKIKDSRK